MITKSTIIIITYFSYPCSHAVLENIFSKELGKKFNITWIMQGKKLNKKKVKWNNSKVILAKKLSKNFILSKVINKILIINIIYLTLKELNKNDTDVLLVRDRPFIVLIMSLFKRYYRFKLFYQYSAPQGDINIEFYKLKKTLNRIPSLFGGILFNFCNKYALIISDIIFPISDYHKNVIASRKVKKRKLIPLTMGIDPEWINRKKRKLAYFDKLKGNSFWITYFGSLGLQRRPDFMLNVIKEILKKRYYNCRLILIGKANHIQDDIKIYKLIYQMGLCDKVILTGRLNKEVLQQYLWYSDLCISPIPPSKNYIISSPTKLYESLGHGIPVVGNNEIFEQKKVIKESHGGILVRYNVQEFVKAIEKLMLNYKLRLKMGRMGKFYVIKNYRYDYLAKKIIPHFDLKKN